MVTPGPLNKSTTLEFYSSRIIYLKVLGFRLRTFSCNVRFSYSFFFRSISIVDGKSVTKPTDVLYLIAAIAFGVFICYLSFVYKDELSTSTSEIANFGNFVSFVAAIIISMSSMLSVFFFRHRLWGVILKFTAIDEMVD